MGKNVTIGGDRLGSGKKMQAHLHNYFRSTHNLSQNFASTAACGVLYPCLCIPAMRGDSFDISLNADLRTIPTKAPLFGSFKMQVDLFQVPMRLYQGILHNNPLAIGLKMSQVLFPTLELTWAASNDYNKGKINTTALLKYLGLSGTGRVAANGLYTREINAIPALAYFDIFKNYYANKQEEYAYQIARGWEEVNAGTRGDYYYVTSLYETSSPKNQRQIDFDTIIGGQIQIESGNGEVVQAIIPLNGNINNYEDNDDKAVKFSTLNGDYEYDYNELYEACKIANHFIAKDNNDKISFYCSYYKGDPLGAGLQNYMVFSVRKDAAWLAPLDWTLYCYKSEYNTSRPEELALKKFLLKNIDDMRYDLLSSNELGTKVKIESSTSYDPYKCLVTLDANQTKMNGLVVKTYQNDIFNNWLNTEWIEGENGINELTKVEIVEGAFSMDALNFAQKLYNMLNRIAVAGATYEDWQDVVYETVKRRQIESPIFCGGMSKEVLFDEIIQNAPTNLEGDIQPLGTLGGRGRLSAGQKGGKVHIKCDEASFIIGIMSITPRIYQTQGNEFYMTELKSMDDLHKPAMDGIGFQDLIGERMAWWDTLVNRNGTLTRNKVGKLPAWIEYMTAVDKAYGEFAEPDEAGFMILARNYEQDPDTGGIKDATTYIDPKKYNYAFANSELTAQNFWAQIGFNIKARRLMSARLIPHV